MELKYLNLLICGVVILALSVPLDAFSAPLPGPADVGRITPQNEKTLPVPSKNENAIVTPESIAPQIQAPAGTKNIHLTLKQVKFEGVSAFTPKELEGLYAADINHDVTMDIAWIIADRLTEQYSKQGYFLSRAYVPEQHVRSGVITIRAVEGYIGQVDLNDPAVASHAIVKSLINRVLAQRPAKMSDVEDFLLRLGDLPGLSFRAVLSPLNNKKDGVVKITLVPAVKEDVGSISFDNLGSRFLGPQEAGLSYQTSFLPLQQTSISLLSAIPVNRLYSASVRHTVPVSFNTSLAFTGDTSSAYPGYTLAPLTLASHSNSAGVMLNYQPIRNRKNNLALRVGIDGKDTNSDNFSGVFVREHARAIRLGLNYTNTASHGGASAVDLSLSRGIGIFDASGKNDPHLSRANAVPDFAKVNVTLTRFQSIVKDCYLVATLSGQETRSILYSSEEFGYGGASMGRAYDASEIIGDKGVAGSLEFRYTGLDSLQDVTLVPYTFYDAGKVWSNVAGVSAVSGSSAGFGVQFSTSAKIKGMASVAFPVTKAESAPIYGGNGKQPRLLFGLSKAF